LIDEAHDMFNGGIKKNDRNHVEDAQNDHAGESAVVVVLSGIEDLGKLRLFDDQATADAFLI
jgi:hypothetical protein